MKTKQLIPCILLLCLSLFLFRCEKETQEIIPDSTSTDQSVFAKGGNGKGGGNGGGHTETAGNNLSFPALLADGYAITPIVETKFEVEYTGPYDGLTPDQIAWLELNGPWYAQKVEGNVWQADFETATSPIEVDYIDWGDAIEAVNPKIGRPYRLELVLYADVTADMTAYKMAELAFPSSKDETQGTNTNTYESIYASVASPYGKIVVQRFEGVDPNTLSWNPTLGQWDGAEAPPNISFQVENNVGGKLIFGASMKGWKPNELGSHRITFYVAGNVNLSTAYIANYTVDESGNQVNPMPVAVGETNTPVVDVANNLTYVDVIVTTGGGGGGGH